MASRRSGRWVAAALAIMVVLPSRVCAQANRSEPHVASIAQAGNSDLHRRFGRSLRDDGRNLELSAGAGVDEARRTLLRRAALYETTNDFANAEADLTAAVQLAPAAEITATRVYFYMRVGRFDDALADFVAAAGLERDNPRWRFAAGRVRSALGDYAAAVAFYDEAIGLGPGDPTFYVARAEALVRMGEPRRARADYDRALDIRLPQAIDRYYAYLGRGYARLMLAEYAGAIADFNSALAIDPDAVNALMWRGYAREKGGQFALALADYERAVAVDPDDRTARASVRRLRSN